MPSLICDQEEVASKFKNKKGTFGNHIYGKQIL